MRKSLLFLLMLVSSTAAFAQPGTQVDYVDNFGPATCTYNGMVNGKSSYRDGSIPIDILWSSANSRWEIYFNGTSGDLLFFNTNDTSNPPSTSAGGSMGGWIDAAPDPGGDGTTLTSISGSGTTGSLLPIELTKFEASTIKKEVSLFWETESEINNEKFEIEHSIDGRTFQKITTIKGKGNSFEVNRYSYVHNSSSAGINHYRLKQIDYDGRFEYSKIITAKVESVGNAGILFPNPSFNGQTTLSYTANEEGELNIQVFDASGKVLLQKNHEIVEGDNRIDFDFSNFSKGMLFFKLEQNGQSSFQKLAIK